MQKVLIEGACEGANTAFLPAFAFGISSREELRLRRDPVPAEPMFCGKGACHVVGS